LVADIVIRSATQDDLESLWNFLAIAAYEANAAAAKAAPGSRHTSRDGSGRGISGS
jgi:hypothetical protein